MVETRSPLKDKPLRNPGQSVREQRDDLLFDKLLSPMLIAVMLIVWSVMDWVRYFFPRPPQPWITSAAATLAIIYVIWQFSRHRPKLRMLKLAEDGEKAVGQHLERLRASGYAVFHDLVGTGFNVDHVIIGPAGVFTIETKTWNKPRQGNHRITFDGETLLAAGYEPDRNPVIQAKAQASWLQRLLAESTGKTLLVRPVILFPGWYIEGSRASRKDLWVLEPRHWLHFWRRSRSSFRRRTWHSPPSISPASSGRRSVRSKPSVEATANPAPAPGAHTGRA